MKNTILSVIAILCLGSCIERTPLQLSAIKDINATVISNGVSVKRALKMERAKSYNGLQAVYEVGSIELRSDQDYDELVDYYSPEQVDYRNGKLLRHQPVYYDSTTTGLYVEYTDKTYKRRRMALLLKNSDHNYLLKAWHNEKKDSGVSNKFRSTLHSVHIGEYTEYDKPFSKMHLFDLTAIHRSRDNLFPTEEADSLYIKVSDVPKVKPTTSDMQAILAPVISEYTDIPQYTRYEDMVNGKLASVTIDDDNTKAFIMLIAEEVGSGLLVVGYGNEKVSLPEVTSLVKSKFLMQLN